MNRDQCSELEQAAIDDAYGEVSPENRSLLLQHRATCEPCRAAEAAIREARLGLAALRAAEPAATSPPVVVFLAPRLRLLGPLVRLAAMLSLLTVGLLALLRGEVSVGAGGVRLAFGAQASSVVPSPDGDLEHLRKEILRSLGASREGDQDDRTRLVAEIRDEIAARDAEAANDRDAAMRALARELERRREEDLRLLLARVASLERRTGEEMARTNQWLRYAVLARSSPQDR